jgi:2-dehydro-3-deoxygalactonokinase
MSIARWIAVDWGTSNLRIWVMGTTGDVIDEIISDQGMSCLTPDQFEPLLLSHIQPWLGEKITPVIACGMVGSRQGWIEAPYDTIPARPATRSVKIATADPRLDVRVISGIQQHDPSDVMRGEETQIAGFLTDKPNYSGLLCLPGTHSKWVTISDGKITHFQTVLTGEIFNLLATKSVLRHSIADWNDTRFIEEVSQIVEAPETLTTRLFGIRANHLLKGDSSGQPRLSGMVIGVELAALQILWQGQKTTVIGVDELARLYGLALTSLSAQVDVEEGKKLTLHGLESVYKELFL